MIVPKWLKMKWLPKIKVCTKKNETHTKYVLIFQFIIIFLTRNGTRQYKKVSINVHCKQLHLMSGIRGGCCNPSYWEDQIGGWPVDRGQLEMSWRGLVLHLGFDQEWCKHPDLYRARYNSNLLNNLHNNHRQNRVVVREVTNFF